jgi:hypothetical protein
MKAMHIDGSVYPDWDSPPESLDSAEARADYVHRVCAAWEYGVHPDAETFAVFSRWKDIFDRFPIVTSPAYHAMRAWFGWEPTPVPAGLHPPTPRYVEYDRLEARGEDPCEECI